MAYVGELKEHARPIAAATLGVAFGMAISSYTSGLFGAHLVEEFGWARSQFAIIASAPVLLVLMLPIVGRVTDRFGVRVAAAIGTLGLPLSYVALSQMNGDFGVFLAISLAQMLIAAFTSSVVFNRVVVERLVHARGIGFAIVMSGPPLAGAIATPLLGEVIAAYDWRVGYLFIGALCFPMGLIALYLLPPSQVRQRKPSTVWADFALVSRNRTFWLVMAGMFLCNVPQALGSSQQMVLLLENGVPLSAAGYLSLYPGGVMIGRFLTGAALDRFAAHIVGAVGLAMPAIGYVLLASPWDAGIIIGLSLLMMGLAQGAEGDVAAYIVGQRFPLSVFGSVVGLVGGMSALGTAIGALTGAVLLERGGSFMPFVLLSAAATVLGAAALLLVGPNRDEGVCDDPGDRC